MWLTFKTFCDHDNGEYPALKQFWESHRAPRKLDSHAVESGKVTFEEFGLLYVISRSNKIIVTPAGKQFYDAAQREQEAEFMSAGEKIDRYYVFVFANSALPDLSF